MACLFYNTEVHKNCHRLFSSARQSWISSI